MKIYFAGPLFTPYVRKFISEHAAVLRANGIDPFVPHERFNNFITRETIDGLIESGTITREDLGAGDFREAAMNLVRRGKISRDQLGLPQMTPQTIFDTDYEGLSTADAVVAILDGTQVDDGTACEIGIFCALMRRDPSKKGIIGFMTDSRGVTRSSHGFGVNMFVLGVVYECGVIYDDFNDVIRQLKAWE
jgi:nucleoside 2-deoxyribosyltransferase